MEIQYIGENLIWGNIGNILVMLAFSASLVSSIAYFIHLKNPEASWKKLARQAFLVHSFSIVGIFMVLFYLILNHRFEYHYVWEHSNTEMPLRYIFSCFWEGQEGSFLLWMFWHVVLSWIVIYSAGVWESGVMSIISLVQVFLSSMILGVVVLGHKIGTNPFILLRDHPDFANLPFIQQPDYLSKIKDGRGLNPLLQNYWMTIHPPTLFLGFASTVVPFAYAMAGLMKKQVNEWIRPAITWTFFGIMILGAGILMGAAWAYEALSFGGFWAWDPVENASLVPWMTLAGLGHVMLIHRHRGTALISSYVLAIVTFFLILYSTFLTRSGILGDSSVHAFTDLGMSGQLVIYMLFFLLLAAWLMFRRRKDISAASEEEHFSSREFWMFIGVLVLVIGAIQITFSTSIPVFNKLLGTKMAPPADAIDHYNRWQVPVAILIALLSGIGQFFRFRESNWKQVFRKMAPSFFLAIGLTAISVIWFGSYRIHYYLLFFASSFTVLANLDYLFRFLKGRMRNAGASVAHIGIGLILCGALISNSRQEVISRNLKNIDLGKDFPNKENILIELQKDTLPMGNYYVTYAGQEKDGIHVYYNIEYYKEDPQSGQKIKEFTLRPFIQLNERMGNVAEPATKHFLNRDIYTHITYAELNEKSNSHDEEYQEPKTQSMAVGDTFITSNSFVIFQGLNRFPDPGEIHSEKPEIAVGARLLVQDINKKEYQVEPLFLIKDLSIYTQDAELNDLGLKFSFSKIDPSNGKIDLVVSERKSNKRNFIIMKAIIFPGINILWLGCIMMIIGSLMAIRHRYLSNLKKPV